MARNRARARRGARRLGVHDLVARIGGDEFVVLSPVAGKGAQRSAEIIGAGIAGDTSGEFFVDGNRVAYSGARVGVAVGSEDAEPDALLREADAAMYAVKHTRSAHKS